MNTNFDNMDVNVALQPLTNEAGLGGGLNQLEVCLLPFRAFPLLTFHSKSHRQVLCTLPPTRTWTPWCQDPSHSSAVNEVII